MVLKRLDVVSFTYNCDPGAANDHDHFCSVVGACERDRIQRHAFHHVHPFIDGAELAIVIIMTTTTETCIKRTCMYAPTRIRTAQRRQGYIFPLKR